MRFTLFASLIVCLLAFSSCGVHQGLTNNTNLNNTQVVLSKKNYKVLQRVQGQAEAWYVLGIGSVQKTALIAEAQNNMLQNADLVGRPRAIINQTVEVQTAFLFFASKYTVTSSGYVIEFVE